VAVGMVGNVESWLRTAAALARTLGGWVEGRGESTAELGAARTLWEMGNPNLTPGST